MKGRGCAPSIADRFFTEGRQAGTQGLLAFPIHSEFQVSVGQVLAEISDPLPSKSFINSRTPLAGEAKKKTDYYLLGAFTFLVYVIVFTNLQTG